MQQAWIANDVPQCGYCQTGMIMAVAALLKDKPKPTDEDIDEAITNICRCGTFQQVREAIHAAAKRVRGHAMNKHKHAQTQLAAPSSSAPPRPAPASRSVSTFPSAAPPWCAPPTARPKSTSGS